MKVLRYFISCLLFVLAFTGCFTSEEKKELTREEKLYRDSVTKVRQRRQSDSIRKTNPLLIVPPDSTYTGDYVDKYPSGITKFRGQYRFGERHGKWMSFYPNGLLWSEMEYDRGVRQGPNNAYYPDGKVRYYGFYKNDQKDSVWSYYDSLGKPVQKLEFKANRYIKDLPLNPPGK